VSPRARSDKPTGAAIGWRLDRTRYLYESPWFDVRQDEVTLPDGTPIVFTYVESPGFVSVVPVTPRGEIVMIREYRYTIDAWSWEIPAGGLGTKPGTDRASAARQELVEETGHVTEDPLRPVGTFHSGIGNGRTRFDVYLATNVRPDRDQDLDDTEFIEVHTRPWRVAMRMARNGDVTDAHSAFALLLCEPWIAAARDEA
jgi:ADP-ribose pyrophosphatase